MIDITALGLIFFHFVITWWKLNQMLISRILKVTFVIWLKMLKNALCLKQVPSFLRYLKKKGNNTTEWALLPIMYIWFWKSWHIPYSKLDLPCHWTFCLNLALRFFVWKTLSWHVPLKRHVIVKFVHGQFKVNHNFTKHPD